MTSPFDPATIPPASLGGASIPDASTTFPASPDTGDMALITDSTTAPTYSWLFVYDGTISGANKWRFIGGAPARVVVATSQATSSATYTDLTTPGPSFTAPAPGAYISHFGAMQSHSTGQQTSMSLAYGATAADDAYRCYIEQTAWVTVASSKAGDVATGNLVISAKYKGSGAGNANFQQRWLEVTPVAVAG